MILNFILATALICFLTCVGFWILGNRKEWSFSSFFNLGLLVPISLLLVSVLSFLLSPHAAVRLTIISGLILIWSVRVYVRLYSRPLRGESVGKYISGGVMSLILSLPILFVSVYGGPELGPVGYVAVLIWLFGFTLELARDFALDTFRSDPDNHGKLLTGGLFRYVRHPHYSGEILMWTGLAVLALPVSPISFLAFLSPVYLLLYFLWFQIPEAEARLAKFQEFSVYKERVSSLFGTRV